MRTPTSRPHAHPIQVHRVPTDPGARSPFICCGSRTMAHTTCSPSRNDKSQGSHIAEETMGAVGWGTPPYLLNVFQHCGCPKDPPHASPWPCPRETCHETVQEGEGSGCGVGVGWVGTPLPLISSLVQARVVRARSRGFLSHP